ncbi:hypothetical protein ACWN8B_10255 [Vagococcus zengguangii]
MKKEVGQSGFYVKELNLAIIQKGGLLDNELILKEWLTDLTGKEILISYK